MSLSLPEEPAGGSRATQTAGTVWAAGSGGGDERVQPGRGGDSPEPGGPGRDVAF